MVVRVLHKLFYNILFTGKTFIAVLLIKEYGLQLRANIRDSGRRAFFVVDKGTVVTDDA